MKTTTVIIVFLVLLSTSCATKKVIQISPEEVKMMTTKQFETNKDIIFKSVISLLLSRSFLIEYADENVGLIRADKRIDNKNAMVHQMLIGYSKDAEILKISFYIEELNSELSEVKITLHVGTETTIVGDYGSVNKNVKERMIYDTETYNQWFSYLRTEIEQKKQ